MVRDYAMINTYIHAMMIIVGVYTFYDHDLATPVSWRGNLTERWLQPCLLFVSSAIFADLCYFTMTYLVTSVCWRGSLTQLVVAATTGTFLSDRAMIIRFWSRCERMYVCVMGIEWSNTASHFFVGMHSFLVCGAAVCVEIHHAISDGNYNLLALLIGMILSFASTIFIRISFNL